MRQAKRGSPDVYSGYSIGAVAGRVRRALDVGAAPEMKRRRDATSPGPDLLGVGSRLRSGGPVVEPVAAGLRKDVGRMREQPFEPPVEAGRSPSAAAVSTRDKLRELSALFRDNVARPTDPESLAFIMADFAEYTANRGKNSDRALSDARVLEIGFGARPYRLMALGSLGIDAIGVDAEVPILTGHPKEFLRAYQTNGLERCVKSFLRHLLADRRELQALKRLLGSEGATLSIEPERFKVMDAADLDLSAGSIDLIVSEDVFEHVSRASLERLLPKMASWLSPGGIALVRPNVFTGITGGHLVEWNRRSLTTPGRSRRSAPWEHLRQNRFAANTFLNRLSRAEFRELFAADFEIVDEVVKDPGLGREYLDGSAKAELSGFSDEELFSNQVLFVLRPHGRETQP
jgi:hypothetical protein